MKKNISLLIFHTLSFLFITLSCDTTEPPIIQPPPPVVKDSIEVFITGTFHRSLELNIKTTAKNKNSVIEVYRKQSNTITLVAEYPITVIDTIITDDNNGNDLIIDTDYNYYAVRRDSTGAKKDTSNMATTKTLAPTSFTYTWQEFSLGSGENPNALYGVWGTDENNVYAVGGVTINDTVYGILHWDGVEWKPVKYFGGGFSIYGFSESDIWVVGGGVFHFNGTLWEEYTFRDPVILANISYTSVWGTSSNNIYFGNSGGTIVHWNGSKAQVVYTNPSTVQVKDMDGFASDFIIGVGTGMIPPLLAVKYNGTNWNQLPINSNWSLNAVSIVNRNHIFFCGGGIYEMKRNNANRIYNSGFYIWDIKYNKQNGVTVASGSYDGIYINNGMEWMNLKGQITNDESTLVSVFLISNTLFCVGSTTLNNKAKIIIGKN
ncbi:MAG: hypothetical protein EHM44_04750 [Ignavibacteriales bacterium]|nr:MAG: hypothetical protein EHM44_04750 [Ignavibacteriales bacterium]